MAPGMALRVLAPLVRPLDRALALGAALLARAGREQAPQLGVSVIDERPAVVLGALQRRGSVIDRAAVGTAGTVVYRRTTTGTAVYLRGRALVFTLALPAMTALAPDTTPRTLLNRNVRGFLDGLRRAGAPAQYFGREWISVGKRPAAVMGFEVLADGGTLIEVFAGIDAPPALPDAIVTEGERAEDRWLGKAPASLAEVMRSADPEGIAAQVIAALTAAAGGEAMAMAMEEPARGGVAATIDEDDPAPTGARFADPVRVPIGRVEAAIVPATGRLWLGGDVLAATFAVRALAEAVARGAEEVSWNEDAAPLLGARGADLIEAARGAMRGGARS